MIPVYYPPRRWSRLVTSRISGTHMYTLYELFEIVFVRPCVRAGGRVGWCVFYCRHSRVPTSCALRVCECMFWVCAMRCACCTPKAIRYATKVLPIMHMVMLSRIIRTISSILTACNYTRVITDPCGLPIIITLFHFRYVNKHGKNYCYCFNQTVDSEIQR